MTELFEAAVAGAVWLSPFLLLALMLRSRYAARGWPALLAAYPLFFAGNVLLTKGLGVAGLLNTPALRAAYLVAVVIGVAALLQGRRRGDHTTLSAPNDATDPDSLLIDRLAVGAACLVLTGLLLFTLVAPVHIWDVLAYHMPMVASYVQNASLEAWPTQDLRQIYRVNAGELQILNVALLSRSDAWVELPNLLALVVFLGAALELARLALHRRALHFLVVAIVLTAPQILVAATTAKNDLVFTAVLLCAFYWMIRTLMTPTRVGVYVALAGLCAALATATKVMGLNVVAAVGLLALIQALRRRLHPRSVLLFGGTFAVALLALAGDVYLANLARSAVPVGIAPGEVTFRIGLANFVGAAHFYLYDLSFKRLVTPQIFEHDFLHYGYVFPFLLLLGSVAAVRQLRERRFVLSALALMGAALFLSVIALRVPIRWDQRFMIWLVPVLTILAASLLERVALRYLLALTGAAAALAVVHAAHILTNEADALFTRSATHLVTTGRLARYVDVPNRRFHFMIDGFESLENAASPDDAVLYVGTDDSWMYAAWGPRFARHVEGVWNAEHAVEQLASRRFRFLVVESGADAGIRGALQRASTAAGYFILANGEHRAILMRDEIWPQPSTPSPPSR